MIWNRNTQQWWYAQLYSTSDYYDKDDNDVPVWDGNLHKLSLLDYFRKIDLWVAQTKVSTLRQGPKLLMKLEGIAFDKLARVQPEDLKVEDGVTKFKAIIRSKFEPVETHRVGKIMDAFLYSFSRKHDEEIADYLVQRAICVHLGEDTEAKGPSYMTSSNCMDM